MTNKLEITTQYSDKYQLNIGYNLSDELINFLRENCSHKKAIIIVDENVSKLHNAQIYEALSKVYPEIVQYEVKSGEESKSFEEYASIVNFVLNQNIERSTPLIAIGGGVTGDLAGFVAASTLRGIPLVHVPTTLLAMVDSSIGGKTGINHEVGKNLIGAFYQPKAVFADLKYLETLPRKEWVGGLSEILKYGFISDSRLFDETITQIKKDDRFTNAKAWQNIIKQSMQIKADIVAKDVKESGLREVLNFGHTFAHVLERVGNYKKYTHGEAVYMGMAAAIYVSNSLGANINDNLLLQYKNLYNLKVDETLNSTELTKLMLLDKKVKNSEIRLVLLKKLEQPYTKNFEDTTLIEEAWKYVIQEFS